MPLYDFKCLKCEKKFERLLPLARYDEIQACEGCGFPAERQVTMAMVAPDYEEYESPASGRMIRGRRERAEDFARTQTRPYELGEKEANMRAQAAEEAELDRQLEDTMDAELASMPTYQLEQLTNEVAAGATVALKRSTYRGEDHA